MKEMASLQNVVIGSLQVIHGHGDGRPALSLVQASPGSSGIRKLRRHHRQKVFWSRPVLRKQQFECCRLQASSSTYRSVMMSPPRYSSTRNLFQRGNSGFKRKYSRAVKTETRIRSLAQDETNEGEEERRDTESQTEEDQLLAHPFVQTNKLLENLLDVQTPPSLLELDEADVSPSESFSEFADQEKFVHLADSSSDTSFRKLVSSSVRFLSGVPQKKTGAESKRRKRKLRWHPLRLLDGSSPSAIEPLRRRVVNGLHRAEEDFMAFSKELGKYMFIMTATGAILATGFQLSGGESHQEGVLWFSWLAGIVVGSMIGAGQVLDSHARSGCRNVVITGSTRGLGKALAREFLRAGDNVIIASRSPVSVRDTVRELQQEVQEKYENLLMAADSEAMVSKILKAKQRGSKVVGIPCDVAKSREVQALADFAVKELGTIDIWINNAGMSKGFRPLVEFSDEEISQIVSTNLTGSLICTREAIRVMKKQRKGGHIFNMDGAGSGGASTPLTAAYGATKCGLRQLSGSLLQECKGSRVGIHTASPGMVLTELLLSGASLQNKKMFNIICEQPETVARALVPNLRTVKGTGKAVNYLTPPRIVLAFVNAWFRRGRWFDEEGRAVYAAEAERLRLWAEGREKSPVTAAMELVPSSAWVSLFSSSVLCAYVILSSVSGSGTPPGT